MGETSIVRAALSSTLFRSAGIYTASRIMNAAIPFLMMPVLTRYLTPADYGLLAMFAVLVGVATPFVGLNLNGAVGVRYFEKSREDLARYLGNCFLILVSGALGVLVLLWLFDGPIGAVTSFPRGWLWAAVFVAVGQFVISSLLTIWQVQKKALSYGLFQNLQTFADVALSLLLVVAVGMDWRGRVEAQLFTVGLLALAAGWLLYRNRWLDLSFDASFMKDALRFGMPLIPHALGGILMVQTDRIFLAKMAGVATAGVYTVGYQFGAIIELLAASLNQAYAPWLFETLADSSRGDRNRIVAFTYLYFLAILSLALLVGVAVPPLLSVFVGKAFAGAGSYVFWIAVGYACHGMYYMVANYIFFAGKTAALAWVTLFTALCNVPCNYLLIKLNGPVGAAQATALAFFLSFVLTWLLSARACPMPWRAPRLRSEVSS